MRTNTAPKNTNRTHEGGQALPALKAVDALRRSVMACMLFERNFYEEGEAVADRIRRLARQVPATDAAEMAMDARHSMKVRHAPLMLLVGTLEGDHDDHGRNMLRRAITGVCARPDDMTELVALWWADKRRPLPRAMVKGLRDAFGKFDGYQLAKYASRPAQVKLRDVMFLVHPKPEDAERKRLYRDLAEGRLEPPGTWENRLSAGEDKREAFTDLLETGKLGYLALLRNLRNMLDAGVDRALIEGAVVARKGAGRVLPFRYVAAARAVPQMEPVLDRALQASLAEQEPLSGQTVVLVDVSGSMNEPLSQKSDLTRMQAAATLAAMITGNVRVFTFSAGNIRHMFDAWDGRPVAVEVPPRKGMAGVDAVIKSQHHGGTMLGQAVKEVNEIPHDRLIVITDEQSTDSVGAPRAASAYMINVGVYDRAVGYGRWTRISGFSESVLNYIRASE